LLLGFKIEELKKLMTVFSTVFFFFFIFNEKFNMPKLEWGTVQTEKLSEVPIVLKPELWTNGSWQLLQSRRRQQSGS
jgi:hypothetical protein